MMNEQNNQELSTNSQASETNPQTKDDRLDYMNQKPHYNRKELTILGVVLVAVFSVHYRRYVFCSEQRSRSVHAI